MNDKLACVLLGSNISPEDNLDRALSLLMEDFPILSISNVWETPAYGMNSSNFLNAAVLLLCKMNTHEQLKIRLRQLEEFLGRVRTENKFISRTIDMDIIIFDGKVLDNDLWSLAHIAVPVSNIWPKLESPETGEDLYTIAQFLRNQTNIHLRADINLENINNDHDLLCLKDKLGKII